MRNSISQYRKPQSHPHSWLVAAVMFSALLMGCTPGVIPTESAYPNSLAACFPDAVFTPEDMRARVECHPDEYKIEITKDTVVLFAFPAPLLDWVGPIFVIHVPSVSEVVIDTDGSILSENYNSSEGQDAIQNVLNDQDQLSAILQQAIEIGN